MKYIVVAIPGAADHPCEELGGKTPLEAAKIPNLNHFVKTGKLGLVRLAPERIEPSSDTSMMNLLGYDADKHYTGRGPIEAANLELKLEEDEIPFRMNFITEYGGNLADSTAGKITTKEAKALINFLNKKVASGFVRFFAGREYRHVAVLKDAHGYHALSARTACPDTILGEKIESHFPKGPGEELLKKLMFDARLLLQDHEVNQVRLDLRENPANMIWLWGQGRKPNLEKFSERFGLSGAVAAGVEYARGLARLTGMTVLEVPETAGDFEAAFQKRAKLVFEALADKDVVFCHLDECDEASRSGDLKGKITALEAMDFFLFSKIREHLESDKDTRVLFTAAHAVPWKMRRHVRDLVPFAVAGKNVMPDEAEKFSELAAKSSEYKVAHGHELLATAFFKH
ncbi:MAG: 2,3-bisphosphoglycerate-independent phosphoglycerate mutase [Candidatus Omnitrophica bacterium]|nr:2,3-bisphosphoglycerate-independent phosphoglycerate mutase [Candidatus Omnitrophota bacterium]